MSQNFGVFWWKFRPHAEWKQWINLLQLCSSILIFKATKKKKNNNNIFTWGEYIGVGAAEGRRSTVVALGRGWGRRRGGGWLWNGVVVLLVDGVVQAESRESIRQALIQFGRRRVVEAETQLDAGLELVEVLVRHALAPAVLAVALAPKPRLIAVRVWRPRVLLVKRRYQPRLRKRLRWLWR